MALAATTVWKWQFCERFQTNLAWVRTRHNWKVSKMISHHIVQQMTNVSLVLFKQSCEASKKKMWIEEKPNPASPRCCCACYTDPSYCNWRKTEQFWKQQERQNSGKNQIKTWVLFYFLLKRLACRLAMSCFHTKDDCWQTTKLQFEVKPVSCLWHDDALLLVMTMAILDHCHVLVSSYSFSSITTKTSSWTTTSSNCKWKLWSWKLEW